MFTHSKLWGALDQLARINGYSVSGLAKTAGLDPTSFNKSKRKAPDGKPRWPSTESISKVLAATESTMSEFIALMGEEKAAERTQPAAPAKEAAPVIQEQVSAPVKSDLRKLPLLQDDVASDPEIFNESGFPAGSNLSFFTMPDGQPSLSPQAWALEITNSSFAPYYQEGDILLVDPNGPARAGDPFLIRRKSEGRLAIYRGQSANPVIGEPLGRIMGAFYSMVRTDDNDKDIAA